jgi:hypothetical protein
VDAVAWQYHRQFPDVVKSDDVLGLILEGMMFRGFSMRILAGSILQFWGMRLVLRAGIISFLWIGLTLRRKRWIGRCICLRKFGFILMVLLRF